MLDSALGFLPKITGVQATLGIVFLCALWFIVRAQRAEDHPYDLRDTLMDAATRKASLNAHILAVMALMATWVCIDRSNNGKDVDNLVLGVLGIFVLGRLGAQGIAAFRPPADNPPPPPETPPRGGPAPRNPLRKPDDSVR